MSDVGKTAHDAWVSDVVARYERGLYLYAARLLRSHDRARDVVQETFLKLCAADREKVADHVAEWLFTVCRNRALDILRKDNRMTQLRDEQATMRQSPQLTPPESAEQDEQANQILRLIEALPPNQREVIRLKFQNGFSYQEISRISGHSVSNVGYLIHAGIKSLRTQLFHGQAAEA